MCRAELDSWDDIEVQNDGRQNDTYDVDGERRKRQKLMRLGGLLATHPIAKSPPIGNMLFDPTPLPLNYIIILSYDIQSLPSSTFFLSILRPTILRFIVASVRHVVTIRSLGPQRSPSMIILNSFQAKDVTVL